MAPGSDYILLEPINIPNGATLPRHPTLEAQREPSMTTHRPKSWIRTFLKNDVLNDAVEQKLKDAIPKSEGDVLLHLKSLLSAYSRLKDNRSYGIGHELSRCFTITDGSRDGVVQSMTSSIDLDISRLKNGTKAKSIFCTLIDPRRSRNSPKHFLVT